ncbi:hypothetical protein DICPUDRAFT_36520 [Dictyostelium purpureum]|uniref:Exocyst complex component Sec8 n=1 Tax=Dictyostelium purpureum TaxID=5786 RepID=F0ZR51_DICPU|nr:uncharacterized protein DICPUDRAFT_36520 [Dictyostelium purpureum]EGC33575.1 hypothetical protein DICPUDRAFT_36520 [Dictyostelium purpureum]|eukprot:XP_003289890.1 hypothetical protein DICPUDRAFT_36520 [Dictyostelium purpureum]
MEEETKKLDESKITKVLTGIPEQYHKTTFEARRTALDYMRSSNRRELLNQIENWLDEVNVETDNIVDVYFQGFNKSIHNYSRILEFMGSSHSNAIHMSKEVEEINKLIHFNNTGIDKLWRRNLEYYYMVEILEKMEELKKVPELLDSYIHGNHYVHAANILVNSLDALNERDLINVNALTDLRQMLTERKESFKDMLVEKLNDHIYLKTPQSLKAFENDEDTLQSNFKKLLLSNKQNNDTSLSNKPSITTPTKPTNHLNPKNAEKAEKEAALQYNLERLNHLNQPQVLKLEEISKSSNSKEDLNINPETDGKLFMTLLVEALNVLDYLQPAVGLILGRISIELKSIISTSSSNVTNVYHSEGRVIPKMPGESTSSSPSHSIISTSPNNKNNGGMSSPMNGSSNSISYSNSNSDESYLAIFGFLTDTLNRNDVLASQYFNIPLVDLLKMIFTKVNMVFKNHLQLSKIFNEAIRKSELKIISNKFNESDDEDENKKNKEHNDNELLSDGEEMTPKQNQSTPSKHSKQSESINLLEIYDASLVWEIIQKEVREMLRIHLQDTSSLLLSINTNTNINNDNNAKTTQRLFSFTNSIVTDNWNGSTSPMISPISENGQSAAVGITIFKASQYNVTPVYPMIVKFTDHLDKILKERNKKQITITNTSNNPFAGSKKGLLRLYIDDFVHRNFLQHIKNDYRERITASIEGTEAFKTIVKHKFEFKLKETKPILKGTAQIFQFIIELFSDIAAMSHYVMEFGAIIQTSLLTYYEKCLNKFEQEIEPTLTGQLMKTDLFKYLITSLAVSSKKTEVAKFQDSREEEYEFKIESELFQNPEKPVRSNQLILSYEKLQLFANISYSLNWLAEKLSQLLIVQDAQQEKQQILQQQQQQQQQQQNQTDIYGSYSDKQKNSNNSNNLLKTPKSKGSGSSSSSSSNAFATGSSFGFNSYHQLTSEAIDALKTMEDSIKDIIDRFKELSRRCLIALRIEYRIHCFYFLEGFKRTQYVCEEERTDPDSFIVELNRDLMKNEESMSGSLPSDKCNFLFSGIAKLIGKLLIARLSHIRSINGNGIAKLCKNVFTLQQNLSNIIVKREIFFDRVRQFYQALSVEEDLLNYLLEKLNQPFFSLEEGKIIIDFLTNTKIISPNSLLTIEHKFKNM